jgi:hypothetical protein
MDTGNGGRLLSGARRPLLLGGFGSPCSRGGAIPCCRRIRHSRGGGGPAAPLRAGLAASGFLLSPAEQGRGELQRLRQGTASSGGGNPPFPLHARGGRSFVVFTDHKPLVGALHRRSDPISTRQQRHLSFVAEFAPSIRHITGESNIVADTLSRPSSKCLAPPISGSVATSVAATCSGLGAADQGSTEVKVPSGPQFPPRHRRVIALSFSRGPGGAGGGTARLPRLPARQLVTCTSHVGGISARLIAHLHWSTPHLGCSGLSSPPPFAALSSTLCTAWRIRA